MTNEQQPEESIVVEPFHEYEGVRIVRLLYPNHWYIGSESVSRPPRVGDIGNIVHIGSNNPAEPYWVENVDDSGYTIWLAIFSAGELERI